MRINFNRTRMIEFATNRPVHGRIYKPTEICAAPRERHGVVATGPAAPRRYEIREHSRVATKYWRRQRDFIGRRRHFSRPKSAFFRRLTSPGHRLPRRTTNATSEFTVKGQNIDKVGKREKEKEEEGGSEVVSRSESHGWRSLSPSHMCNAQRKVSAAARYKSAAPCSLRNRVCIVKFNRESARDVFITHENR